MGVVGATGETVGEGAKKSAKWGGLTFAAILLGSIALGALATVLIGGAIAGAALGGLPLLGAIVVGGAIGAWGGAGIAAAFGIGAGALGLVFGGGKGLTNHMKRDQASLEQQKAQLIDEQQQLIGALQQQDAAILNPGAPEDGRWGARLAAEQQATPQR
jgi:hypothetical protein